MAITDVIAWLNKQADAENVIEEAESSAIDSGAQTLFLLCGRCGVPSGPSEMAQHLFRQIMTDLKLNNIDSIIANALYFAFSLLSYKFLLADIEGLVDEIRFFDVYHNVQQLLSEKYVLNLRGARLIIWRAPIARIEEVIEEYCKEKDLPETLEIDFKEMNLIFDRYKILNARLATTVAAVLIYTVYLLHHAKLDLKSCFACIEVSENCVEDAYAEVYMARKIIRNALKELSKNNYARLLRFPWRFDTEGYLQELFRDFTDTNDQSVNSSQYACNIPYNNFVLLQNTLCPNRFDGYGNHYLD